MCEPDPRNLGFVRFDSVTGNARLATALDQLRDIAQFTLCAEVPESVRVHFETAKNLYAYAWFVYRFHAVAEQQALTSLEFALRERLEGEVAQFPSKGKRQPNGLSGWLNKALAHGLISNAQLSRRMEWALQRARSRADLQMVDAMQRSGTLTAQVDYSSVKPSPEDLDNDWIGVFIDSLPKIRNAYAHGSSLLHPTVLRTFEIVSDLINQLFVPAP
ncbi:UNVERIFIED_ORG: hypothetical protein BDU10_9834 [Burkholderia sp. CF145]